MKKLIVYFLLTLSLPSVWSQNKPRADIATQSNLANMGRGKPVFQTFDDRYDGIKGSRFFYNEAFHEGEILFTDSTFANNNVLYRFDQLAGAVQAKSPDGKEIYLKTANIVSFKLKIEGQEIIFTRSVTPENLREYKLLQVIYYSPTLQFLRDSRKKLTRVNDTGAYSKGEVYDEIQNDFRYYIKRGDKASVEVKPTRKSLIKALPDMERKIEQLFDTPQYKKDLSVSKLGEMMKKLDEAMQAKAQK
jgi:hypothetical protein